MVATAIPEQCASALRWRRSIPASAIGVAWQISVGHPHRILICYSLLCFQRWIVLCRALYLVRSFRRRNQICALCAAHTQAFAAGEEIHESGVLECGKKRIVGGRQYESGADIWGHGE